MEIFNLNIDVEFLFISAEYIIANCKGTPLLYLNHLLVTNVLILELTFLQIACKLATDAAI